MNTNLMNNNFNISDIIENNYNFLQTLSQEQLGAVFHISSSIFIFLLCPKHCICYIW